MNFGDDAYDAYSQPIHIEQTKFATVFELKARVNPDKPGRTVQVQWDDRAEWLPDFAVHYSYTVRFTQIGATAGNHYHKVKRELWSVVHGTLRVVLEDIKTKEREELVLSAGDNKLLYVQAPFAHAVVAVSETAVLLVQAMSPDVEADTFEYVLV